jgi:predicted nuclease with TOPRIM domain
MASDELKIVLEDVKEKFDAVIDAFNMVKETLDRDIEENRKEHQEFRGAILGVEAGVSVIRTDVATLKTDVSEMRKDLNDHRDNTELHAGENRKKA